MSESPAERHARNLRFRDNAAVFNDSAQWLDTHRDEALPPMGALLAEGGPAAVGIARVLGQMNDPRAVPLLEGALSASDDALAFEAARGLARTVDPAAAEALRRGAASAEEGVVRNALRGIELRKDPALCDAVRPHLGAAEPIGTYAARARDALGC
jgi:hypothetical protein